MGTTIRWGAAVIHALALPVLAATGCSNPLVPSDVLFLQVYDLEVGTGREAAVGDRVVIDYVAWTYDADQEAKGQQLIARDGYAFFLGGNQVNAALDQGLVGMRVGGLRQLVVPASYAQAGGAFGSVPPNTPVVADVRLVDAESVR